MNTVRVRRETFVRGVVPLVLAAGLVVPVAGCRSGSSLTKPSWMTFGQKSGESAPALADAVPKPSAAAQPYPTTSTPEPYALPAATAQSTTAPGAAPAAVTYGSTPPPAVASTGTPAATPPSPFGPGSPPAVAPQVGPYATSSGAPAPPMVPASDESAPPSGWTSPGLGAVPPAAVAADALPTTPEPARGPTPWTDPPAANPAATAPPQRFADARAASPAWTPAPLDPPPTMGDRYGPGSGSRFSADATPAAATAAATMMPGGQASAVPAAPPAELAPAATPTLQPATPPVPQRRPDPGYRPGGTSSYRSARSSLAGDPPAAVQPASFEAPPGLPN